MRDAKAEVGNRNYEIMTCDLFLLCRQERDEKAKSARSSIDELARFFELLRLRQTLYLQRSSWSASVQPSDGVTHSHRHQIFRDHCDDHTHLSQTFRTLQLEASGSLYHLRHQNRHGFEHVHRDCVAGDRHRSVVDTRGQRRRRLSVALHWCFFSTIWVSIPYPPFCGQEKTKEGELQEIWE